MPELPEVETTLRGIEPHIVGHKVTNVVVRFPKLRWPIPTDLREHLVGKKVQSLTRRGKYILIEFKAGTLILHLGMSGRTRILPEWTPAEKHDHVDIIFDQGIILRFTDPRRFGALLWCKGPSENDPLLKNLGKEPLSHAFNASFLYKITRTIKRPIKNVLMDSKIVTGVGNIYAAESLFLAKISPIRPAQSLSKEECAALCRAIKRVLKEAIQAGGTTIRDFSGTTGLPGYFVQKLSVYGRSGQKCLYCGKALKNMKIGQRSTVFCPNCQN